MIGFFVHRAFVEAKNPCLDIPFGDQTGDLLGSSVNRLFSTVAQCLVKLLQSILNGTCVRIDYYNLVRACRHSWPLAER